LTHHDVEDPLGKPASFNPWRGSIRFKDIRYPGPMQVVGRNCARKIPARMEMGDIETTRKLR